MMKQQVCLVLLVLGTIAIAAGSDTEENAGVDHHPEGAAVDHHPEGAEAHKQQKTHFDHNKEPICMEKDYQIATCFNVPPTAAGNDWTDKLEPPKEAQIRIPMDHSKNTPHDCLTHCSEQSGKHDIDFKYAGVFTTRKQGQTYNLYCLCSAAPLKKAESHDKCVTTDGMKAMLCNKGMEYCGTTEHMVGFECAREDSRKKLKCNFKKTAGLDVCVVEGKYTLPFTPTGSKAHSATFCQNVCAASGFVTSAFYDKPGWQNGERQCTCGTTISHNFNADKTKSPSDPTKTVAEERKCAAFKNSWLPDRLTTNAWFTTRRTTTTFHTCHNPEYLETAVDSWGPLYVADDKTKALYENKNPPTAQQHFNADRDGN